MKKIILTLIIATIAQLSYAQFNTSGSNTTTMDNVGIGTTSPGARLQVVGVAATPPNMTYLSTGNVPLKVQTRPDANYGLAIFDANTNTSIQSGEIVNGTSVTNLTFQPFGGNVGVGTSSPNAKLDVIGTVKAISFNVKGSTSNEVGALTGTGMGYDPITYPVSAFGVLSGSGITSIGYNPLANTGGNFSGDGSEILFRNTIKFIQPNATGSDYLYPTLTMNNGNVGIGTTTPHEALSVNGDIRSKQIKVEMNNWPDFVFAPTYRLPSLNQVKNFIDKNQHLPDMPSEKEVAKDGLNLGEINKLLTKKVEELTLYLIEEHKKNNDQQEQLNKLKQQMAAITKALNKN